MVKLADLDILKFGNTVTLVGSVFAGEGRAFLALFPEERGDHKIEDLELLDMDGDDWARLLRQTDTLETEVTARLADGTVEKAILRKSARGVDSMVQWKVFKRDGYACRYCGKDDVPLSIDHLVCWEVGGPTTVENLLASCKKDNKVRGNTPYGEWLRHPHYLRVSAALTPAQREANAALLGTLDAIPRSNYIKKR